MNRGEQKMTSTAATTYSRVNNSLRTWTRVESSIYRARCHREYVLGEQFSYAPSVFSLRGVYPPRNAHRKYLQGVPLPAIRADIVELSAMQRNV